MVGIRQSVWPPSTRSPQYLDALSNDQLVSGCRLHTLPVARSLQPPSTDAKAASSGTMQSPGSPAKRIPRFMVRPATIRQPARNDLTDLRIIALFSLD